MTAAPAPVRFGAQLWSQATDWPAFRDAALAAEAAGWDSVWTWDHVLAIFGPWQQPILEGWTALAGLASITRRVRLGLMVGANTFRNPGLTAKLATTLDQVSAGRAVLGIGGAWFVREHEAFGIDLGASVGARLDWLDESVGLIRRLLDGETVTHQGRFYRFRDALCAPPPIQAHLPILVGGSGPRKTLRTVALRADGWNTSGDLDEVRGKLANLDRHCADVGRDRSEIEMTVSFPIVLRDRAAEAEAAWASIIAHNGTPNAGNVPHLLGSPDEVAGAIRPYVELGFRTIIVRLPAPYDRETIERIGEVVALLSMPDPASLRVVELAGGVGGAKLAHGLQAHLGEGLTVVVNTADDLERHGLLVCPDHDTVMYTLAGIDNREWGWGIAGETFAASEMLARYGEPTWFRLGDRDLATHIVRTRRWRDGERMTPIALDLQAALGVRARILPMTDAPVRTLVLTDEGWLGFQTYFVGRHQEPEVIEVRFEGIGSATATPEVITAFEAAEAIVVAPSNPFVSVAPILAVPGIRGAIDAARARGVPVAAISGIVGGRAIKGPADRMIASLAGEAPTAVAVARRYIGWVDLFVLDAVDAGLEDAVRDLGFATLVTDTMMVDDATRSRLAGEVVEALAARRR